MNNSNSINTPLHVVNFVASQSNFAFTMNLLFRGSVNYTPCRFTFAALHAEANNICVKAEGRLIHFSNDWLLESFSWQNEPISLRESQ